MVEQPQNRSHLGLVLVVLLLPALVWLSGTCVRSELNARTFATAQNELGAFRANALRDQLRLESLCQLPAARDHTRCAYFAAAGWLQTGGILTGVLGLGLLGFVAHRASQARQSRDRLPALFRQAVRATGIGAALLGLALSVLVTGSLALLMAVFVERIWVGFLLGILLLGGYAALRTAATALAWGKPLEHQEIAVSLTRAQAPALWRLVDEVARTVGTAPPDNLVLTPEPNCYAIEVPVILPNQRVKGRTLCLSLPLLHLWDERELRAVVAHELAHFHGEDTRYSREYAPALRAAAEALETLRATLDRDARAVAVLPLLPIFSFTVERFTLATAAHSREREFAADGVAARVAGALPFATALLKVAVAPPAWSLYLERAVENGATDPPPAGAAVAWLAAQAMQTPQPPDWLARERTAHPVDTHPPLHARLDALGVDLAQAWRATVPAAVPAAALVGPVDAIDRDLTSLIARLSQLLRVVRQGTRGATTGRSAQK